MFVFWEEPSPPSANMLLSFQSLEEGGDFRRACPPAPWDEIAGWAQRHSPGNLSLLSTWVHTASPSPGSSSLKPAVVDRFFRATGQQVDREPGNPGSRRCVGQQTLLPQLSEGRLTRCGALAHCDVNGPETPSGRPLPLSGLWDAQVRPAEKQ